MVPTWKSDQELCFAIPNEGELEKRRPGEFCVWSAGTLRMLSAAWPDSVIASLRPRDQSKPRATIVRR